ncbi:MAG: DEAD/DEAH box helicase [Actinomycetota bacterium]|nr:DEAD/DEAH box helicase [Actinomycetota bacterium]
MPFKRLGLDVNLVESVQGMGYDEPTPIQVEAIPHALAGRDIVGCAQTGTGKTAAFILPTLQRISDKPGVKALVVTPTRELAHQIEEVAVACGRYTHHKIVAVYGGVKYMDQEDKLRRGVDMVVATPGRLLDLMNRRTVDLSGVEVLVLDEADRMLDMGFWPDVRRIINVLPPKRQNLLFSATMSAKVLDVIGHTLDRPVAIEIGPRSTPVDSVNQCIYPVDSMQKDELLVELLKKTEMERVLVFSRTKRRADYLAKMLGRRGLAVATIHSDLTQAQRQKTLDGFRNGRHRILIGTDIVARGIDVENISHVINFDMPSNPEDYVHRIGRTARAGESGTAISLFAAEELADLRDIESFIGKRLPVEDLEGFDYVDRFVPDDTTNPPRPRARLAYNGGARRMTQRRRRR